MCRNSIAKKKGVANFVKKFGGQEGGWKSWDIRICIICTFAERQCALLVQFHHQRPAQQSSSELLSKGSSQENLGKPFLNQVGFFLKTWGRTNYMSQCNTITNRLWLAGWVGGRPNFKLPQGYMLYRVLSRRFAKTNQQL